MHFDFIVKWKTQLDCSKSSMKICIFKIWMNKIGFMNVSDSNHNFICLIDLYFLTRLSNSFFWKRTILFFIVIFSVTILTVNRFFHENFICHLSLSLFSVIFLISSYFYCYVTLPLGSLLSILARTRINQKLFYSETNILSSGLWRHNFYDVNGLLLLR